MSSSGWLSMKIPKLYETEGIPSEEKIIYRRYWIRGLGYYWLIAELDEESNIAFGYANLNDDAFAEWGYFDLNELLEAGAELDEGWEPCKFKEAMERIEKRNNV
ncbi:MAG: DUF2958 domain-containing protein [Nitrososphaerota archaeon]|nr:DUF2958 domain-containing protein [Nitrososphaerota archaeon]